MIHKVEIKAGRQLSQREIDGCMAIIKEGCAVDPEFAENCPVPFGWPWSVRERTLLPLVLSRGRGVDTHWELHAMIRAALPSIR